MSKQKLAIIGTGIAGMGCAHYLQNDFDITVFEKADRIGGHTNTVYVEEEGIQIPIDTGFIVFNNENYPHLLKLFDELKVPIKKTQMSFSAMIPHENLEYCGSSLNLIFAQRKNIFSPRYIRFLLQLTRFNKECVEVLNNIDLQNLSIADYCKLRNFDNTLLDWYLLPMSSALWSTPPETTSAFPAATLVRFFKNHGFLGLNTQFQWYTVDGGSEEYKKRLIAPFKEKILVNSQVKKIDRLEGGVEVITMNGESTKFDKVIIATHADEARLILEESMIAERAVLNPFHYEKNRAILHTDESVMPKTRRAWSSWNYCTEKKDGKLFSACTYWMNSLQQVSQKKNYFVTINESKTIDKTKIIKEIIYEHPIFTVEAMQMQKHLPELNNNGQIFFCGSYFRFGFHEDALMSAVDVCNRIKNKA